MTQPLLLKVVRLAKQIYVYDVIDTMYDDSGYWYGLGMTLGDYVKTIPLP